MAGTLIAVNNFTAFPLSNGNASMTFSTFHADYDGSMLPGEPLVECKGESAPVNKLFSGPLTCTPDTRFKYSFGPSTQTNQLYELFTRAFDTNGQLIGSFDFQSVNFTKDGCYHGTGSFNYVLNLYG